MFKARISKQQDHILTDLAKSMNPARIGAPKDVLKKGCEMQLDYFDKFRKDPLSSNGFVVCATKLAGILPADPILHSGPFRDMDERSRYCPLYEEWIDLIGNRLAPNYVTETGQTFQMNPKEQFGDWMFGATMHYVYHDVLNREKQFLYSNEKFECYYLLFQFHDLEFRKGTIHFRYVAWSGSGRGTMTPSSGDKRLRPIEFEDVRLKELDQTTERNGYSESIVLDDYDDLER